MRRLKVGERTETGHVIDEEDAETFNRAFDDATAEPTLARIAALDLLYTRIITKKQRTAMFCRRGTC